MLIIKAREELIDVYNVKISSFTDIGDVKQTNQDCIFTRSDCINNHYVSLFIVADGCGGLAYGEEISNLIVTYFTRVWMKELNELLKQKDVNPNDANELLEKAIKEINAGALTFSNQVNSKVGSTLSLLLTIDRRYYIKNVGDSRIYLMRKNKIMQLTEDQSLVADMIRNGEITTKEAKTFKKKNVLTMCIGVFEDIKIYSKQGVIKNKDTFILCCDGLHNHVEPEKMLQVLKDKTVEFEDKAVALRKCINEGEANDNVSAVVCSFEQKANLGKRILLTAVILLLCALIAAGVFKESRKRFHNAAGDGFGGVCHICCEAGALNGTRSVGTEWHFNAA